MSPRDLKHDALRIIEKLPADASWEDLMHEIYVRECIERGLADSNSGRVREIEDVRKEFGLA